MPNAAMAIIAAGVSRMVWPSGFDLATISVPMMVPPPGLFSTITGWPSRAASFSETMRAEVSVDPPGA